VKQLLYPQTLTRQSLITKKMKQNHNLIKKNPVNRQFHTQTFLHHNKIRGSRRIIGLSGRGLV
ncbi:hypothetical protein, partial [Acetobacter syzygii]|uniref:hypothetical protein n=1 Tax=Acetobacter syzygii TaxID=146476 RepID=UPI00222E91D1